MRPNLTRLLVAVAIVATLAGAASASSGEGNPQLPGGAKPIIVPAPTTTTTTTTTTTVIDGTSYTDAELAKIKAWVAAVERHKIRQWVAAVERYQARLLWEKIDAFAKAVERAKAREAAAKPKPGPNGLIMGAKTCGGNLPPCYVMLRESKGYLNIWNGGCSYPCGSSSASGKWQFIRGTWNGYGGYRNAADAPESVQDAKARQLWAGGRGCGHWAAC